MGSALRAGRVWLLVVALGAFLAAAAAHASGASAYVYWANEGTDTIGRANLDGTGANQRFIAAGAGGSYAVPAYGVAVDGGHVYWGAATGTIGRARLDGTGANQSFIAAGALNPFGVAVDGAHVYWVDEGTVGDGYEGTIGRANLDGTGANQSFITRADGPLGVAVDGAHVYWANSGKIGRANLDGTGANASFITRGGDPFGVAVDAAHVYWANGGTIGRANLDGTGVNASFIAARGAVGVAVDGAHVYWANRGTEGDGYEGTIGRAKLDGTRVNQSFITGANRPVGVAVDALSPPPMAPAPVVSSLSLSSSVFPAADRRGSLTARKHQHMTGTDVRYRDSQAAVTTFTVLARTVGHRHGRRCQAGRPSRHQRRCTRLLAVGSFSHRDLAGKVKVHFSGRVRGRKLHPGRYRLAVRPRANDKTGHTVTVSFQIIESSALGGSPPSHLVEHSVWLSS